MTNADQPMDHVAPDPHNAREQGDIEKNFRSKNTWLRFLFMIVVGLLGGVALLVTSATILINFFYLLLTGGPNERVSEFGRSLAIYLHQVTDFMTLNSDVRPFPIDEEWPVVIEIEES